MLRLMRRSSAPNDWPHEASFVVGREKTSRPCICLVVGSLRGGGTERVCVTIANGLTSRGYFVKIVVLNLNKAQYETALDKDIELVNLGKRTVREGVFALWRVLARTRPAVVLAFNHQLAITCAVGRAMRVFSGAVVGRNGSTLSHRIALARGMWQRVLVPMLTRILYRLCDRVVAQSEGMARDLIESFGLPQEKMVTIGNPVEIKAVSDQKMEVQGRLPERTILFVGRLEDIKDPLFLIESFAICLRHIPDLKLAIAGQGALEDEMRKATKRLGISEAVLFLGFQREMMPLYRGALATVLCSRVEGMPNCLLESLAYGTPVVSLDCPHGPAEIIIEGENGYLVRERKEDVFAQAIVRAVSRTWNREKVLGSVSRFSSDAVISAYEDLLVQVANEAAGKNVFGA